MFSSLLKVTHGFETSELSLLTTTFLLHPLQVLPQFLQLWLQLRDASLLLDRVLHSVVVVGGDERVVMETQDQVFPQRSCLYVKFEERRHSIILQHAVVAVLSERVFGEVLRADAAVLRGFKVSSLYGSHPFFTHIWSGKWEFMKGDVFIFVISVFAPVRWAGLHHNSLTVPKNSINDDDASCDQE